MERDGHCFHASGRGVHEADLVCLRLPALAGDVVQAHDFVARIQKPEEITEQRWETSEKCRRRFHGTGRPARRRFGSGAREVDRLLPEADAEQGPGRAEPR